MDLSEPFDTVRRFRQGDPLACDLFNFVMESVMKKAGIHRNGTIFQKSGHLLAYADYIDIIGRTKRDVTAAFSAVLLIESRNLFILAPTLPPKMMSVWRLNAGSLWPTDATMVSMGN